MYYTFDSRIRYSEVDSHGLLTMESLMNYFQDCSTFQSEDNGAGLAVMYARRQAWVVSAWQVVVYRYPALCEKVVIGTIPYEMRGFIGYRNFFLQTQEGEPLAIANSDYPSPMKAYSRVACFLGLRTFLFWHIYLRVKYRRHGKHPSPLRRFSLSDDKMP